MLWKDYLACNEGSLCTLTDEPAAHVRAKETNVRMVVATDTMFVRMVEALVYDKEKIRYELSRYEG